VFKGKPSSLLGLVISDEGKKFYMIGTRSKLAKPMRRWLKLFCISGQDRTMMERPFPGMN
jgi:hypothetical protein